MNFKPFLFSGMAALAAMLGGMSAEAQEMVQGPKSLDQLTTEVANSGPWLINKEQVSQPVQAPVHQAPPGGPPPVIPAIQVTPAPAPAPDPLTAPASVVAVAPATTPASGLDGEITLAEADIRQEPPNALPQQKGGKWKSVRVHTEVRSRPRDTAFDVKAELVTKTGWMFGAQYVNQSGNFSSENLKEIWKGQYTNARAEIWGGRHGASQDGRTRWSFNAFGRVESHQDAGKGQSRPGTGYPYSYSWKNAPRPITQLGVRARIERDLVQNKYQQFTVFVEGEGAATVAGESGLAFNAKTGLWSRTQQTEVSVEVGVNNTEAYANGYGRYYLTKSGQLRPFVEAGGEVGTGYSNLRVGGGIQVGIGKNGYGEFTGGYNTGTSGNGLALMGRAGIHF